MNNVLNSMLSFYLQCLIDTSWWQYCLCISQVWQCHFKKKNVVASHPGCLNQHGEHSLRQGEENFNNPVCALSASLTLFTQYNSDAFT